MAYEILWETGGVNKHFHGHVTDDELIQSLVQVESDPRFDSIRYVINDFLQVEDFTVSEDGVLMASAIDRGAAQSNPHIRIAVVATDTQVHALAKLYAASPVNAYPTEVFLNDCEARRWISATSLQQGIRRAPPSKYWIIQPEFPAR